MENIFEKLGNENILPYYKKYEAWFQGKASMAIQN